MTAAEDAVKKRDAEFLAWIESERLRCVYNLETDGVRALERLRKRVKI